MRVMSRGQKLWVSGLVFLLLAIPTGALWWFSAGLWSQHAIVDVAGISTARDTPIFQWSSIGFSVIAAVLIVSGVRASRR